MFSKPGKEKNDCRNYRPISLLPTLAKVFEKLIYERLQEKIDEFDVIPNVQFGFRRYHSTVHQLMRVSEIIEKGFEDKKYTTAVFLDVARAFDSVWIEGLKYKLHQIGLPSYLKNIIFSFLEDRTFKVRINGSMSTTRSIKAGVPQGSCISPLLYNIFMHDIPIQVADHVGMFADDMVLITQDNDLEEAIEQLQNATNRINSWLLKWCIQLNANKCEAKIFTLRKIRNHDNICINNEIVPWNPSDQAVKYLGLYLDQRLTWRIHINKKLNQSYNRLRDLYPLINRKTTLRTNCILLLYKALIRTLITYACPVWSNTSKTNIKKIEALQNKVLRMAVDAPWFVRNEQLRNELNMMSMESFIQKTSIRLYSNLEQCPSATDHNLGVRNIHVRLKRKLPQDILTLD